MLHGEEARPLLTSICEAQEDLSLSLRRVCETVTTLTRLRVCDRAGNRLAGFTGPPQEAPPGFRPWFVCRQETIPTVFFGHWSTLGRYSGYAVECLDTGCVHGGRLTALRVEDGVCFEEPMAD